MPRFRRTATAFAALAAISLSQLPMAAPAAAALPEPARSACRNAPEVPVRTTAVFNDPVAGTGTGVIEGVCSLIKQAPAGSSIELAAFVISGDAGADYVAVLLDAFRRGVHIRLVMDGYQIDKPAAQTLVTALGSDRTAESWAHVCSHLSPEGNTTSCQGTKGMHNKFLLFSRTAGERNVVVQASNNLTDVNSLSYWNNAVVITGSTKLYRGYGAYFDDLAAEVQTPDYYRTVSWPVRTGSVSAAFYPAATGDPIVERLDRVECAADGGTSVEIGQSEWDATRLGIVDSLARLVDNGCDVRVVRGLADDEVLAAFDDAGVPHRALDGSTAAGRIHSKYIVVSDGDQGGGWVMTGSHNFNQTSLRRNDEAMVELSDPAIVAAYAGNFERLWQVAPPA